MPGAQKQSPGTVEQTVMSSLREAMKSQQLQQTEVAARVGVSASQLSRILNGKRAASFTEVVTLAHVLGVDLGKAVAAAERPAPTPGRGVRARAVVRKSSPVTNDTTREGHGSVNSPTACQ